MPSVHSLSTAGVYLRTHNLIRLRFRVLRSLTFTIVPVIAGIVVSMIINDEATLTQNRLIPECFRKVIHLSCFDELL